MLLLFAVQRKLENRQDVHPREINLAEVSTPCSDKELESSRNSLTFVEKDKFTGPSVVEGKDTEVTLHLLPVVCVVFVCFIFFLFICNLKK